MDERDQLRARRPGRAARAARRASLAAAAACVPACAAWAFASAGWAPDMVAVFTAHWVLLAAAVAAGAAALRSWRAVGVAALAVALGVAGLVPGRRLGPPAGAEPGEPTLRLLVFNAHALNEDAAACFDLIGRADADVVVLIEPEINFSRTLRWDRALDDAYPSMAMRAWVKRTVSPIIVLSRLPMEEIEPAFADAEAARFLVGVRVETGFGPVAITAGQPRSPRSGARWAAGNREAALQAAFAHELASGGLPVVVGVDLNSTPAAHRGSVLRAAGLRPAKGLLTPAGTFPASLAWPARIAIDDAWHTPDLRVVSWELAGAGGSDHAGVVVELAQAARVSASSP